MQNAFFQAICRVGIFMICARAIVHFRPQEAYEKYLKLLVSVMVLIQLLLPVGSFFWGGRGQEAAEALAQFQRELEQSMEKAEKNAAAADAVLEQMTLEELRNRMDAQGHASGQENETQGGSAGGDGTEEGSKIVDGEEEQENGLDMEIEIEVIEPVAIGAG